MSADTQFLPDLFEPITQLEAVIHHADDDLIEGIEETDPERKRKLLSRALVLTTLAIRLSGELATLARVR